MQVGDAAWQGFIGEATACVRPATGTQLACGATMLGTGRTADVWSFSGYAVKLFRHRVGLNVPEQLEQAVSTYARLGSTEPMMPRLLDHGIVSGSRREPDVCGWAIFTLAPGEPMDFGRLRSLTKAETDRFVHDMVVQAVRLETRLRESDRADDWNSNYSDARVIRLQAWREAGREIASSDVDLASEIGEFIRRERKTCILIHGDFNPPNILVDFGGIGGQEPIVRFVDPMISCDAHESNWRHFTAIPDLADRLLDAYGRLAGEPVDPRLMYAMGAFTHLYNAIADPAEAAFRRSALDECLDRAQL